MAKALRDFAKGNPNLIVKGGVLGDKLLTAAEATALAEVAPREELLSRFAGALQAPMQHLAGLLQAPPRDFAYGLKALIEQQGGAADAGTTAEAGAEARRRRPTEHAGGRRGRASTAPDPRRPLPSRCPRPSAAEPRLTPGHPNGGQLIMATKEEILDTIAEHHRPRASELLKDFEEKFGVTAAGPVAFAAAAAPAAAAPPRPPRSRTSSTSS